jgi:hypothetical protein
VIPGVGAPGYLVVAVSVADGEAPLREAGILGLVEQGDGGVFERDATAAVCVEDWLVTADAVAGLLLMRIV